MSCASSEIRVVGSGRRAVHRGRTAPIAWVHLHRALGAQSAQWEVAMRAIHSGVVWAAVEVEIILEL